MAQRMIAAAGLVSVASLALALSAAPGLADGCPVYPDDRKNLVYSIVNEQHLVRDSHIGQDGCGLYLAIIIGHAANEDYAREVGDNMVRLTKSLGPGPARDIGKGIYDYTIGVYRPDKTRIAIGAKNRSAKRILW